MNVKVHILNLVLKGVESILVWTKSVIVSVSQRAQQEELDKIEKHIKSSNNKEKAKPLDKPEQWVLLP